MGRTRGALIGRTADSPSARRPSLWAARSVPLAAGRKLVLLGRQPPEASSHAKPVWANFAETSPSQRSAPAPISPGRISGGRTWPARGRPGPVASSWSDTTPRRRSPRGSFLRVPALEETGARNHLLSGASHIRLEGLGGHRRGGGLGHLLEHSWDRWSCCCGLLGPERIGEAPRTPLSRSTMPPGGSTPSSATSWSAPKSPFWSAVPDPSRPFGSLV